MVRPYLDVRGNIIENKRMEFCGISVKSNLIWFRWEGRGVGI